MQLWQELLSTALVGTAQQPLRLSSANNPMDHILSQLDLADHERALLSAAGVVALWQRAGYNWVIDNQTLPALCPIDSLPRCSAQAGYHLTLMLQGRHKELLPEWLAAVAKAGRRAPEEALPELLAVGRSRMDLRHLILPVLGERGRWLAKQQPQWYYAAGQDAETVWQIGSRDERLFWLRRWRETNPDQARERLLSTWPEETAKDRAAYLATLAIGLSMADEPFLESVLDDRSQEVRRLAADLLAHLPEARLVQRMLERVQPLLKFIPAKLLSSARLEVTLPETCDKAMLRDGIEPNPPTQQTQLGAAAWQLQQLISAIPPAYWVQAWGKTPAEIIQAAARNDWQTALIEGWIWAAQRHRSADWAEALLQSGPINKTSTAGLLVTLSPEERETYVLNLLRTEEQPLSGDSPLLVAIQSCQYPWSVELTEAVLDKVKQRIKQGEWDWPLQSWLPQLAHHIPPKLHDEVATDWPEEASSWSYWQKPVDEFLALLHFRRQMLQAIDLAE